MTGPLIGLSGYARSGKDAAGATLGWQRLSFADKLRDFLLALDPIVTHDLGETDGYGYLIGGKRYDSVGMRLSEVVGHLGWEEAKDQSPEVRDLLQRCGTEAGRKVLGADVWVDAVLREWDGKPAVVTDVRFPNEATAVHARGGIVIRIERPGVGPKTSADGTVHESETALDGFHFDGVVYNSGTLDDLAGNVLAVTSEWFSIPNGPGMSGIGT